MEALVTALKAAADPTRLRVLALCRRSELTVSELVRILGQSQPRVSRHLKILDDAGLLSKSREGNFAFLRLADRGAFATLARTLADSIPQRDETLRRDLDRLEAILTERADRASRFFRDNAGRWNEMRQLHGREDAVEKAIAERLPDNRRGDLLDIGTGTGRMLELFASEFDRAVGVDLSREMLSVARAALSDPRMAHCQVRQGDMQQLPVPNESADVALVHQVLHYATDPARAIREAARTLKPGGRLLIVDFAPHEVERLRIEHAHNRLGFSDPEISEYLRQAGLVPGEPLHLPGETLTTVLWQGDKPKRPDRSDLPSLVTLADGQAAANHVNH